MLPSPYGSGLGLRGFSLSRPPVRSLSLRPDNSLTTPRMALSMGFRYSVSLISAIQVTELLILTPAGLTPAEHTSLCWTHIRTSGIPAYGSSIPTLFTKPEAKQSTCLAHNFAAHRTIAYFTILRFCVDMVCDLWVSPIFPSVNTLCPVSPSLQWVAWAPLPHLLNQPLLIIGTMFH